MKLIKVVIHTLLFAMATATYAVSEHVHLEGITANGNVVTSATDSDGWISLERGLYIVEVYEPAIGTASDPCGTAGGDFDTASVSIFHSPDKGLTAIPIDVPGLGSITSDAIEVVQLGTKYKVRVVVSSVGASTCISIKFAKSQS